MKNQWTNFFGGSVQVAITGIGTERVINECVRRGIGVWNVKKLGSQSLSFHMYLKDISKIRPIIRKSDCKLKFLSRKGLPFLIRKGLLNSGFLLGIVAFLCLILLLSNMVWGIEIVGAKPETEHIIMKELKNIGVEKGKLQFFLTDVESIQRHLSDTIQEITWVGVELNGTTYHFEVVEKNQPDPPERYSPRDLVASKKAVITKMFVEEGKPLKKINQFVEKGEVLVSGMIGPEGKEKLVPARGKIYGETWYKATVTEKLSTKFNVLTGEYKDKRYIKFGQLAVPIWGFKKHEFSHYKTETVEKKVKFLKWELPISYQKVTNRETEEIERKYTIEQAIDAAVEDGRKKLEKQLPSDAEIIGENVLLQSTNNGKVKLEIKYNVIENIATTRPLVQGD